VTVYSYIYNFALLAIQSRFQSSMEYGLIEIVTKIITFHKTVLDSS